MSSNYGGPAIDVNFNDELTRFNEEREAEQGVVRVDPNQTNQVAKGGLTTVSELGQHKRLQAEKPVEKVTQRVDTDGKPLYDYTGINETAHQQLQELIALGRQSKQETEQFQSRLRAKRDVMEKHPAIAQIGRIAAAAANAYIAPGSRGAALVHGAGAVAGEYFKDTPESLQAEITEAGRRQVATQAPITGMAIAEARTEQQIAHQQQVEDRLEKQRLETEKKNTLNALNDRMANMTTQAANGTRYPDATVRQQALNFGATAEQAEGYVQQAKDAFAGYEAKKSFESDLSQTRSLELIKAQRDAQIAAGLALQRAKNQADAENIKLGTAATRMEAISQEHDVALRGKETGLAELEYWDNVVRGYEATGFIGPKGTTKATAKRLINLLSNPNFTTREGNELPITDLFEGLTDAEGKKLSPQAVKKQIIDSIGAVNYYDTRAPRLFDQYDSRKKSLSTKVQPWFPDLRPGGYLPPPTVGGGVVAAARPPAAPAAAAAAAVGPAPPNKTYQKDLGPAAGYRDGPFSMGGQPVFVKDGRVWGK